MGTHLFTYDDPPAERDIRRAMEVLGRDGVLAYPNDLNWAFGCHAASSKALDRVRLLKPAHPRERPFGLVCSSIAMAADYAVISNAAYRVLKRAWPGPYTILLAATRTLPRQLKDKRRVVGIRIPASAMVRTLVERLGSPLATTSVPVTGRAAGDELPQPPHFGYQVFEEFGHAVDLVLDFGTELPGLESTVIDWTGPTPVVLRPGAGDPALFQSEF